MWAATGVTWALAHRLPRPGGAFLNHAIPDTAAPRSRFSYACVSPDGKLVAINLVVESLREHHCLTLRVYVRRHEAALRFVGEPTYRVWRLSLAGSAHGLEVGRLNVYQALLARRGEGGRGGFPLMRQDWYTR